MKKSLGLAAVLMGACMLTGSWVYADEGAATASSVQEVSKTSIVPPSAPKAQKSKKAKKKTAQETWVCPMGDYSGPKTSDGKCPKCGMDLIKQEKSPAKKSEDKKEEAKPSAKAESPKAVWVCPMGDFTGDKPGKCPNCGMDLVKKK